MGRKSKKGETVTPWCYYCEQEFTNDNDLILHQKARHFKCSECGKKMATIVALKVHLSDVRGAPRGGPQPCLPCARALRTTCPSLTLPPHPSSSHEPPPPGPQGDAEEGAQCQGGQGGHYSAGVGHGGHTRRGLGRG